MSSFHLLCIYIFLLVFLPHFFFLFCTFRVGDADVHSDAFADAQPDGVEYIDGLANAFAFCDSDVRPHTCAFVFVYFLSFLIVSCLL